jgi:hypothetical protein
MDVGYITKDHHFLDGAWTKENCTTLNSKQWTYNAGVHLAGASAMWNVVSYGQTLLDMLVTSNTPQDSERPLEKQSEGNNRRT